MADHPIDRRFAELKAKGRKAFIPFVTAGDPSAEFTAELLPRLASAGADLIELGFPFSDPIADGPTIQASYTRALDNGIKLDQIFAAVGRATSASNWDTPLVGMVSYSIAHKRGPERFAREASKAGFHGLIVPDLVAEEAGPFTELAAANGLKIILLVTPNTPESRAKKIVELCSGFVYCVSVVGITGERDSLPPEISGQLAKLREMTKLPLCVGFGVSRPEHVRQLKPVADGVIVGSALVRHLEKADADGLVKLAEQLAGELHQ